MDKNTKISAGIATTGLVGYGVLRYTDDKLLRKYYNLGTKDQNLTSNYKLAIENNAKIKKEVEKNLDKKYKSLMNKLDNKVNEKVSDIKLNTKMIKNHIESRNIVRSGPLNRELHNLNHKLYILGLNTPKEMQDKSVRLNDILSRMKSIKDSKLNKIDKQATEDIRKVGDKWHSNKKRVANVYNNMKSNLQNLYERDKGYIKPSELETKYLNPQEKIRKGMSKINKLRSIVSKVKKVSLPVAGLGTLGIVGTSIMNSKNKNKYNKR